MKLHILGCGPIIQSKNFRYCSGYLIDRHILFDCGPGVWSALNRYADGPDALHTICLTHFHTDHTGDLAPVLMARYLSPNSPEALNIFGPPGLIAWFDHLRPVLGSWGDEVKVNLTEIRDEQPLGGYELSCVPTGHTAESLAYRLTGNAGGVFFYSGDTGDNPALVPLMRRADLAVLEASNMPDSKIPEHLTPEEAARLAAAAGVARLVLTHMYPEVSPEQAFSTARRRFQGELIIARDDLKISF